VLGTGYLLSDRIFDAIRTLERSLDSNKTNPYPTAILAAAYAQAGRQTEAAAQAEKVREIDPRFDSAEFGSLLRKPELRTKLVGALNKAGL
jgi:Flp pilus assembly protein TadD